MHPNLSHRAMLNELRMRAKPLSTYNSWTLSFSSCDGNLVIRRMSDGVLDSVEGEHLRRCGIRVAELDNLSK